MEAKMIELDSRMQEEIDSGIEPELIDPRTRKSYVLVAADELGRLRNRPVGDDSSIEMRQVAVLVDRAMRDEDADDPTLEYYQRKYGTRQ
jgi:hypothetical protein